MLRLGQTLLAVLFVATSLHAQPSSAPAVLRGFVLADSTERPIIGAELTIDDLKLRVLSDDEGSFRLANIKPGTYIVAIRALGYQQIWTRLSFADGDSLERDFLMAPTPVAIAGVRVTGKSDSRNPKVAEFERRRAMGFGSFVSQERIDSSPGKRLSNFMREMPGLSIQQGNSSNATWAVGTRGSGSILKSPSISSFDRRRGAKGGTCYSSVYLDGTRVYGGNPGEALFDIDQLHPGSVAGIEFYASAAQTPPELNVTSAGTCGVVVIWTR
jgi:hypothetical protein